MMGDNVGIGANIVTIVEIKIRNNVIIDAGSFVVISIQENSVVVGNPARTINN